MLFPVIFLIINPSSSMTPSFDHLPPDDLRQRLRFTGLALRIAWIGAGIALLAALFRILWSHDWPVTLIVMALLALLATGPVIRQHRVLRRRLNELERTV